MISFKSSAPRKKPPPRVPGGIRLYAIGDIHGRADLLEQILKRVDADLKKHPVPHCIQIFLGDYIDRGPASRQVLDLLVARERAYRTVFLKGNHETFMTNFLTKPSILENWQQFGGLETLMSYGIMPSINADPVDQARLAVKLSDVMPESHRRFLRDLNLSFTCGDFLFVHAGIRPGVPLLKQKEEDLLWIRQEFLFCEDDFGKVVVHGHTPVPQVDMRPNRINIDTGAYATGTLTCLVLETHKMRII